MILIVNINPRKNTYEAHLDLNHNSFVNDIPNTKYFSNILSVSGNNGSITLTADKKL